jgi:hypothetical protein
LHSATHRLHGQALTLKDQYCPRSSIVSAFIKPQTLRA